MIDKLPDTKISSQTLWGKCAEKVIKPTMRSVFAVAATALSSPPSFIGSVGAAAVMEVSGLTTGICALGVLFVPDINAKMTFAGLGFCAAVETVVIALLTKETLLYTGLQGKYNDFLNQPERLYPCGSFFGKLLAPEPGKH